MIKILIRISDHYIFLFDHLQHTWLVVKIGMIERGYFLIGQFGPAHTWEGNKIFEVMIAASRDRIILFPQPDLFHYQIEDIRSDLFIVYQPDRLCALSFF